MKNLYHVQDSDRPAFVIANSYAEAINKWKRIIAKENNMEIGEIVEDPAGVAFLCDGRELIIDDDFVIPLGE